MANKVRHSKESATGYATTDKAMLCGRCASGRVSESAQGSTAVYCHAGVQGVSRVPFVVVRCSRFEETKPIHIWSKATELRVVDGALQIYRDGPGAFGWHVYATGARVDDDPTLRAAPQEGAQ